MTENEHDLIFDVEHPIGEGGQADVYLVRLRETGGVYAGKFLREAWDPLAREAFKREALRQGRLVGRHVVPVVAWNLEAEKPFIILEYMPHGSLADELKRRGPLDVREGLVIAREIAVALADMHARGVIHRDLKPGNILRGLDGRWKLNDLGCGATMTVSEFVRAPGFLGTPAYAAPEQLKGVASAKSDVFSLGVILHELVMGRPRPQSEMAERGHGVLAPHRALVDRLCAKEMSVRPSAAEAVGLIDAAIMAHDTGAKAKIIQPGATLVDRTPHGGQSSGPWWLLGAAALGVLALFSSSGGSSWDSSVGRYRGGDGRFRSR